MTTEWKWRLFLFVRATDATTANKRTVAEYLANNGSGQSVDDELGMFLSPVRLSTTGAAPAQAFGLNTAVKPAMRNAIATFLGALDRPRYAVIANTTLPNYANGELVATNFPVTPNGQIVTWQMALAYLKQEFGLQVIPDADEARL